MPYDPDENQRQKSELNQVGYCLVYMKASR